MCVILSVWVCLSEIEGVNVYMCVRFCVRRSNYDQCRFLMFGLVFGGLFCICRDMSSNVITSIHEKAFVGLDNLQEL